MSELDAIKAKLEKEVADVAAFHAQAQEKLNAMQTEMAQFQVRAEAEINRRNGRIELLKEMIAAMGAAKVAEVGNG